ncbi:MAG: thiol-disulfide oxidoreductase DCC family protein [Mariniblastus sp.]
MNEGRKPEGISTPKFEVLYDGQCPLCKREIDMIRRKDKRGQLILTDIASAEFTPTDRTLDQLMREIHGRNEDGSYVTGVEVFRQIYSRLGFGFVVSPTRLPVIRHLLDLGYTIFAKLRFWHAMHRMKKASCKIPNGGENDSNSCAALPLSGSKK